MIGSTLVWTVHVHTMFRYNSNKCIFSWRKCSISVQSRNLFKICFSIRYCTLIQEISAPHYYVVTQIFSQIAKVLLSLVAELNHVDTPKQFITIMHHYSHRINLLAKIVIIQIRVIQMYLAKVEEVFSVSEQLNASHTWRTMNQMESCFHYLIEFWSAIFNIL